MRGRACLLPLLAAMACGAAGAEGFQSRDAAVMELVLRDLQTCKEMAFVCRDPTKRQIIMHHRTPDKAGMLADGQIQAELHTAKGPTLPAGLLADLRRRNPWKPLSWAAYKPQSKEILVRPLERPAGRREFGWFERKFPKARAYVEAWRPGYAPDGKTALVRFWVGPTPHGAAGTYLLTRRQNRWAITWRNIAYFV